MSDKEQSITHAQQISAFADGELTGEDNLHLLEQAQADPRIASEIRHQQQLRTACQRVMNQPPAAPADLRHRITALAEKSAPSTTARSDTPRGVGRIGRWAPAAIAALFLLGTIGLYTSIPPTSATGLASVITAAQVDRFENRHLTCTESIDILRRDPTLPDQLTALPAALQKRFDQSVPALDLSAIGYVFEAVGQCTLPGNNAVHLIYRALPSTGRNDTISLWMRPDQGDFSLTPGKIYTRTATDSIQRMLMWKQGNMIYYLVGDQPQRLDAVAQALVS